MFAPPVAIPAPHRILVVEDNSDDLVLLQRAFTSLGHAEPLAVARSAEHALAYLFDTAPLPRLMITDLDLPGLSGLELLERMRASPAVALLPVILLTGRGDPKLQGHARRLGVVDYLLKPQGMSGLTAVVGRILRHWSQLAPANSPFAPGRHGPTNVF